ncbi:MAG: vitamin B12-dependent ribonucleotide reductase (plasmid) [Candidatus Manganitrophus sp.]|nr:MAG: vitamin B12-dependent ribonucleotide reductase [Candidatus Manganitrophus sp.]
MQTVTLSPNAIRVLEKRYLAKSAKGEVIETAEELFRRVAKNIAEADPHYNATEDPAKTEDAFYALMVSGRFLPNSPTLMNAGRELQQLSACFVLPVGDSICEIFDAVKQTAIIHKSGGGTGFSFSRLRPKDDLVRTTGGVSSGPVSFMSVFNHTTEAIKQGGTRRGANMGILRVDHPDILDFIHCKADTGKIINFNISVAITDEFMRAAREDKDYPLINPRTRETVKRLSARMVLDEIAKEAHATGEPGLFFIDVTNRTNPTPHIGEIEATNPCGEQPLLPYESCNLGSINLERHLKRIDDRYEIDWEALEGTIRTSVHFLDNVIDMNRYPIRQIEEITKANRKIGLGVMGFARMLFKLGVPYNSLDGLRVAQQVMAFVRRVGYEQSGHLAELRGVYPNWRGSLHEKRGQRVRNAYITTIAPTGTVSMIADTSGGCEPEFSLIWYKNVMDGEKLPYILDYLIEAANREGFWSEDLLERIVKNKGSVNGIDQVPPKWQRVFVTAHEISPEWHVRMQAAFQEYSDSAVSKTINLPSDAGVEEVTKAYLLAYELGCKGITVYRDGARPDQVMNVGSFRRNGDGSHGPAPEGLAWGKLVELADIVDEKRIRVKTADGNAYLHVGLVDGQPREIFGNPALGAYQSTVALVCRLGSTVLRLGGTVEMIMDQLNKVHREYGDVRIPLLALNRGFQRVMEDLGQHVSITESCPECRRQMRMVEGCMKCHDCGFSRC